MPRSVPVGDAVGRVPGGDVPDQDLGVDHDGEGSRIGMPGDAPDWSGCLQTPEQPKLRVPDPHRLVLGPGGHPAAVGAPGDGADVAGVRRVGAGRGEPEELPGSDPPGLHPVRGHGLEDVVVAPRELQHGEVRDEATQVLTGGRVPDVDPVGLAPGRDPAAVRAPGQRQHPQEVRQLEQGIRGAGPPDPAVAIEPRRRQERTIRRPCPRGLVRMLGVDHAGILACLAKYSVRHGTDETEWEPD